MNIKTKILVTKSPLSYDDGKCVFELRYPAGDIFCFIWVKDSFELRHALGGYFISAEFQTFGEALFYAKKVIQEHLQRVVLLIYDESTKNICLDAKVSDL